MNKLEGYKLLKSIIAENKRHKDYKRVCELAETYYKMRTGDGIDTLLQQIVSRETDDEFEMRKKLTNSIIPPTLSSTRLPFQKVVRKRPKVRKIDWETGDVENKKSIVEQKIENYWGHRSLEEFLEYAFIEYNFTDPNAFLITEFDEFNPVTEKASPYPFIASSEEAIMFEYKNNILQYLVVRQKGEGLTYTIYLGYDTVRFTEVESAFFTEVIDEIPTGEDIAGRFYRIETFQPKASKVPAERFGYLPDAVTQGRTFVSVFHDVIPYLNKILKNDSELDLTTAMTAFPQRFRYVSPCPDCSGGRLPDGSICGTCGGTGKEQLHSSTMDVVTLDLPRDKEDMIDLEGLLVYKSPPLELLKFQQEYVDSLRASVYLLMFNKELLTRNELANTATEVHITEDNLNDTLRPFSVALSAMWCLVVTDIATFTDFGDGLIVEHLYPEDFKFKSQTELMDELKRAKDAGASTSTIAAIEDDINEILYADRPEELKIMRIKNNFNPFRGYSEESVRMLIAANLTTKFNAVLWANLESIFNDLERENVVWIYDMADEVIREKVYQKCREYIEQLEKPVTPELGFEI